MYTRVIINHVQSTIDEDVEVGAACTENCYFRAMMELCLVWKVVTSQVAGWGSGLR